MVRVTCSERVLLDPCRVCKEWLDVKIMRHSQAAVLFHQLLAGRRYEDGCHLMATFMCTVQYVLGL